MLACKLRHIWLADKGSIIAPARLCMSCTASDCLSVCLICGHVHVTISCRRVRLLIRLLHSILLLLLLLLLPLCIGL